MTSITRNTATELGHHGGKNKNEMRAQAKSLNSHPPCRGEQVCRTRIAGSLEGDVKMSIALVDCYQIVFAGIESVLHTRISHWSYQCV